MGDVTLRPDLHEIVAKDAEQEARSVNEIVNEAVEQYLRDRQRAKLSQEIAAYEAMHPALMRDHLGQWVAVHGGQLADHDEDGTALHQRVRARFGREAVLIRRVTENASEELWFRSPNTGKIVE